MWSTEDPRIVHGLDRKHFRIIVTDETVVTAGEADTDEGWSVLFGSAIRGRTMIGERDAWPSELRWVLFPE